MGVQMMQGERLNIPQTELPGRGEISEKKNKEKDLVPPQKQPTPKSKSKKKTKKKTKKKKKR